VISMLQPTDLTIDQRTDEDFWALRYSAQYIFDSKWVSLVGGGQWFDSQGDGDENSIILEDSVGSFTGLKRTLLSSGEFRADSYSSYLYTTLHLDRWADLNAGVNYTELELPAFDVIAPFVDGERRDRKVSPKFGLSIYPTKNTTVRSTYYQSLGISSISDIGTIEPTYVGSFSQVFGDLPGADIETYGFGLDHKFPKQAYFGVEYLHRKIDRESITVDNVFNLDLDNAADLQDFSISAGQENEREEILKSYLYFILGKRASATLNHVHSELKSLELSEKNEKDQLTFGVNYFHPSRLFGFSRAVWTHQKFKNVLDFEDGTEDFWNVDLGVGYRLPKRHGAIKLVFSNILNQDFDFVDSGRGRTLHPDFSAAIEASINF